MATQLSMFKIKGTVDYGELPGSSNARRLGAIDGQVYVAKGHHSMAQNSFVLVNEYVCTRLAHEANMPVPAMKLIEFESNLWFGSSEERDMDSFTPDLYGAEISNKPETTHLAVFDVFVQNVDRNHGNVLAKKSFSKRTQGGFEYELLGIDFGHALIPPAGPMGWLDHWQDPRNYYRTSVLVQASLIENPDDIVGGVKAVEALDDDLIQRVVHDVPGPWWPSNTSNAQDRVITALKRWRSEIRSDAEIGLPIAGGV